jgi:hypothetical protein
MLPPYKLAEQLADDRTAAAIAALVTVWQPFSGVLDRVEIVYFMPVDVVAWWPQRP